MQALVVFVEEFEIVKESLWKTHGFAYHADYMRINSCATLGKAAQKSNRMIAGRSLVVGILGVSSLSFAFSWDMVALLGSQWLRSR